MPPQSPPTNTCIPLSPSPSFSPPFSYTGLSDESDDHPFALKDTTLNTHQHNALGVDFSHTQNNNSNNSNTFDQWFKYYQSNSVSNPIENLLNSDISTRNSALAESTIVTDNGQSISNAIDNTVFQQLQGLNISNHLIKSQKIMSSSPQTPRDGTALLSSFDPSSTFGGAGLNKSAADFDFGKLHHWRQSTCQQLSDLPYPPCQTDMLAASFLNDQVAAFDNFSAQLPLGSDNRNNNKDSFFANLPLVGSPMTFNNTSNSPPLQNAFRNFSSANNMLDASSISIPHQPVPTRNNSTSSSSSAVSPTLASPAFDAMSNFPFALNNSMGNGGLLYNSPIFSGLDTPALIPDDGNDLANSLTTSPMWGQLELGSISLFPQQQQFQKSPLQQSTNSTTLQQNPSLPTISPKELSLPLPDKNTSTLSSNDQVKPATSSDLEKSKKRVRDSPAFGDLDEVDEDEENDEQQGKSLKKRRRSTASATPAAVRFNGTRHTSSVPLPVDAPTQPRTYYGPESKTSKRAVPAAAARKVAAIKAQAEVYKRVRRSVSIVDPSEQQDGDPNLDENGDEIEGVFKEAIEMSIEAKRRQNTVAARRSRARKAEHLAGLEDSIRQLTERVNLLENEKMVWMMRAMAAGWSEDIRST